MAQQSSISRRNFVQSAGLGAAAGVVLPGVSSSAAASPDRSARLPREVRVASMTLMKLESDTQEAMMDQVINRLEEVVGAEPDIICLPEIFNTARVHKKMSLREIAESVPGPTTDRIAAVAEAHQCYIIAPITAVVDGQFFNSAVVIDRTGAVVGQYDKIMPTSSEMQKGIACGAGAQVIEADFGKFGVQTCFDVNWTGGWEELHRQGAEIVFWPSAYPGGRMLQARAWENDYYIVTSPWGDPANVIDITGDILQQSGTWRHWVCTQINLERQRFTWGSGYKIFEEIQQQYGARVLTEWYHEENWGVLESRSPDLTIAQIIEESGLVPHRDVLRAAEKYKKGLG